jgi:hypothetical protein
VVGVAEEGFELVEFGEMTAGRRAQLEREPTGFSCSATTTEPGSTSAWGSPICNVG